MRWPCTARSICARSILIVEIGRLPTVRGCWRWGPLLHQLILALTEEAVNYEPGSRADLIARLIDLELRQLRELSLNVPLPKDPRLQRLCAELLSRPADRRRLDEWGDFAGASPRTLARLFQRDLGMSFNLWRQRVRFHHAVEALSDGQPIALVAHDHGYRSASAFTAAFVKVMGMPPSQMASDQTRGASVT